MSALAGKRVLLVEDEFFIAEMTGELLQELGMEVVGPASDLASGLDLATTAELDAAVLDLNLRGDRSDPIAAVLAQRGVPFVFVTGYARVEDQPFAAPMLGKPIDSRELEATLASLLAPPEA
jgi:CheY-like chemotaxis protein